MPTPEDQARENIDRLLTKAGWAVRDQSDANILTYRGLAIRNFTLKQGHGFADYLLYVDGRAAGVVEAKNEGVTLTGVETRRELATFLSLAWSANFLSVAGEQSARSKKVIERGNQPLNSSLKLQG